MTDKKLGRLFLYKGLLKGDKTQYGFCWSLGDETLAARLKASNTDLIWTIRCPPFFSKIPIPLEDRIHFALELETLSKAKLPILDILSHAQESSPSWILKAYTHDIHYRISQGESFSEAAKFHPNLFDEFGIGLIKIGEETGTQSVTYGHLKEYYISQKETNQSLKSALTYPLFLLLLMGGLLGALIVFLIPPLKELLLSFNQTLDPSTQTLILLAEFLSQNGVSLLAGGCVLILSLSLTWYYLPPGRLFLEKVFDKIPIIGAIRHHNNLARLGRFMGLSVRSGIPLLTSLSLTQGLIPHRRFQKDLAQASDVIQRGASLSEAFGKSSQFSKVFLQMIRIGESSGSMGQSFEEAAKYHQTHLSALQKKFLNMIHPLAILALGGILGWIAFSIFIPLYSHMSSLEDLYL